MGRAPGRFFPMAGFDALLGVGLEEIPQPLHLDCSDYPGFEGATTLTDRFVRGLLFNVSLARCPIIRRFRGSIPRVPTSPRMWRRNALERRNSKTIRTP
jgi:hypothetical protein